MKKSSSPRGMEAGNAAIAVVVAARPRRWVQGVTKAQGRVPKQLRSRQRLARILDACRDLIAESDSVSVSMAAVARRAAIPIASLYQYFPTKAALIARLFEHRLEQYHSKLLDRIARIRNSSECPRLIYDVHMEIYEDNRRDVFFREIWAGAQASRETRDIHVRDNEYYSRIWLSLAKRGGSRIPHRLLQLRATAANEMWDGAIRLAITLSEKKGLALMNESILMGIRELGLELDLSASRSRDAARR